MARMPGAVWRPLPRPSATRIARYDLVIIHTMVGSLAGTDGYFRGLTAGVNSHFGTGGHGEIWQWVDTAVRSGANAAGNHRSVTIENADMGPGFAPWNTRNGAAVPAFTAAQVEANARICAWAHRTHGVPLVAAPSSLPGSRGVAYHRQGVDPWRASGGEVWSSSRGKVCPGDRRIAQIPQIIARARQLAQGDDMTPEQDRMLRHLYTAMTPGIPGVKHDGGGYRELKDGAWAVRPGVAGVRHDGETYALVRQAIGRIAGLDTALRTLAEARGDVDVDALLARVDETVRGAMADTVRVDISVDGTTKG